ncbi:hypothetical protein AALA58_04780, partial [Lactococcus ileimucosae]
FTMAGEQYRYLENQGGGNHLIIRNDVIRNHALGNQEIELQSWYSALDSSVQAMVQPVSNNFDTGTVTDADIIWSVDADRWIPMNLVDFLPAATDATQVDSSGTPRAFSLSLADVTRLSGSGLAFPTRLQRGGDNNSWWWLRTPGGAIHTHWQVTAGGLLVAWRNDAVNINGAFRPALIINQ